MNVATSLLRHLDPETAHQLTLALLPFSRPLARFYRRDPAQSLQTSFNGVSLRHPIGIAAGFDKDAEVYNSLFSWGFSFVEVGSVTPKPQIGNPRPRVFRLPESQAIINRYGFNNSGLDKVLARMATQPPAGMLGFNLGKNKDQLDPVEDYLTGIRRASDHARYLVINVSSPNTSGLRDLQHHAKLEDLLRAIKSLMQEMTVPALFLKIAPDLGDSEIADIVRLAIEFGISGLIVSNTTIGRPETLLGAARDETGGLSGDPLFELSTDRLRCAAKLAKGKLTFIGAGGISSGEAVYAKIRAGAHAVQLYTGLVYHGPALLTTMLVELQACLERDGFTHIRDAVGADLA